MIPIISQQGAFPFSRLSTTKFSFWNAKRSEGTPILLLNELSTTNYADKRTNLVSTTKCRERTPILLVKELTKRRERTPILLLNEFNETL
jgi:hypothetical protein